MDETEGMKTTIADLSKAQTEAMKRLDEGIKQVNATRREQTEQQRRSS